ncbi:MAG TPA: ABC transporter substrate binding protein, partial [Methylomicrobium sp.]|nr:ABC transporter substrate binding protein [Methylomicrobium sp.]
MMTEPIKRIAFSLCLIFIAAGILLWSDRHNRLDPLHEQVASTAAIPIAILQHSSNPLMDEIRLGILDALNARHFIDGQNIAITTYNAEGDLPTGNLMAQKIASGDYRLAVSISTVMLQALANANRAGRVTHVFGAVTAPTSSGVGIKALDSLDKPPYLTGIGTPQPVTEIFRVAKQINPALKTVGVVWNPAEVNSEFCTKQARAVSAELGLTLLEAPVEQTKDVREAAESLVARGIEAFWTGGDATVNSTVDTLIEVARNARIPVFSNIAGHAERGSLFDYGADYHEVGEQIGRIAADILNGANSATIPVKDFVPRRILLNEDTAKRLKIIFPDEVRSLATPVPDTARIAPPDKPLDHVWKIRRLMYVESPPAEEAMRGIEAGLKAAGLQPGRDFVLSDASAQGDMSVLSGLADAAGSDGTELLMTLSTPTLQTVMHKVKKLPIVFTFVANPFIAGAGKDDTHHLPNVTGVYTLAPFEEMVLLLRKYFPD